MIRIRRICADLGMAALVLAATACRPDAAGDAAGGKYFPIRAFMEEEAARLNRENPRVEKTVRENGVAETRVSDSMDWHKELKPFMDADINLPAWRDSYAADSVQEGDSLRLTYTAVDERPEVRLVEVIMHRGRCTSLRIVFEKSNELYRSSREMTWEPAIGYTVSGNRQVRLGKNISYGITARWLPRFLAATLEVEPGVFLPFRLRLETEGDNTTVVITNGEEKITADEVERAGDSLNFRLPLYDSEIRAVFSENGSLQGSWHNHSKGSDYIVPFAAEPESVPAESPEDAVVGGRWKVRFGSDSTGFDAIGEFRQEGSGLNGTFLTETGDFRYLEGHVTADSFYLSRFDGAHAFLFRGRLQADGRIEGTYWSGRHYKVGWTAERNDTFRLRDANTLTGLREGYERIDFSFPSVKGKTVSLSDERFRNKVVILQIMGSWCPNCIDETRFLDELYDRYRDRGLEIIALCFERTHDLDKAVRNIERVRKRLGGVDYEFVIAGYADKEAASRSLPMINEVMAYPTSVFLDRSGAVRRIHTGFAGPGTGKHYGELTAEITALVEELLDDGK